ncbi:hypothetical protein AcV7_009203 [Taiwanofungus camphoratus]|nr:hypothetical protein AcV7_009203 [Antrodia cinnamomea]
MSSNISIATMEQELLDQLIAFGHDYRALRYTWVMSLALLIYDLCLTFDKEV